MRVFLWLTSTDLVIIFTNLFPLSYLSALPTFTGSFTDLHPSALALLSSKSRLPLTLIHLHLLLLLNVNHYCYINVWGISIWHMCSSSWRNFWFPYVPLSKYNSPLCHKCVHGKQHRHRINPVVNLLHRTVYMMIN